MRSISAWQVTAALCDSLGWPRQEKERRTLAKKDPVNIGIERTGGVGDGAYALAAARALQRKFPDGRITAHMLGNTRLAFLGVQDMTVLPLSGSASEKGSYDLYYNLCPDGGLQINCRMPEEEQRWEEVSAKYHALRQEAAKKGLPSYRLLDTPRSKMVALETINDLYGLDARPADMCLAISNSDRARVRDLAKEQQIVTVHDWAYGCRQTKCWFLDRWAVVTSWLKSKGFTVYQIGARGEDQIPGAISMLGKLSIPQSLALMLEGVFHIDNESSLAHYGAAYGHPTFVLLGPTSRYWQHDENFNIKAGACHECEGYPGWTDGCPRRKNKECMRSITPELVVETIIRKLPLLGWKPAIKQVGRRKAVHMKSYLIGRDGTGDISIGEFQKQGRLPVDSSSLDQMECAFVLELLGRAAGLALLREARRVLKNGGTCLIRAKDLETSVLRYSKRETDCETFLSDLLGVEERNLILFDAPSIRRFVQQAGFKDASCIRTQGDGTLTVSAMK